MKYIFISCIALLLSLPVFSQYNITISIDNIRNDKGLIYFALYNCPDDYNNEANHKRSGSVRPEKGSVSFTLYNLPKGVYGMSVLHDENMNKKMDFNLLGIPKEGFGFSENPGLRVGAPNFDAIKFELKENTSININLRYIF